MLLGTHGHHLLNTATTTTTNFKRFKETQQQQQNYIIRYLLAKTIQLQLKAKNSSSNNRVYTVNTFIHPRQDKKVKKN